MRRIVALLLLSCVGFFVVSCATPIISGDCALSQNDIREIEQLLRRRSDIEPPISEISGDAPTRAHAFTGTADHVGARTTFVRLERHGGAWQIVEVHPIVITGI